jgi:peptidoglycan hydrolase-like protein with peptidoglycan-binding domain
VAASKITEVQAALTAAGYTAPADGAFGPATLRAMESFQRANGLPVGYLTVSTVEALGVSPF